MRLSSERTDRSVPRGEVGLAGERLVMRCLETHGSVALRDVSHQVRRERSLRVRPREPPILTGYGFRKDDAVAREDRAALYVRSPRDGVVVVGHGLERVRPAYLDERQIPDQHGEQHGERRHEDRQALTQRHTAEHSGLRCVHAEPMPQIRCHAACSCCFARRNAQRGSCRIRLAGTHDLRLMTRTFVSGTEQEAHDDEAGQKRATTLAHEGQRHSRQWDESGHASHDDKGLERDGARETDGREGGHVGSSACCRQESSYGEEHVEHDHARASE